MVASQYREKPDGQRPDQPGGNGRSLGWGRFAAQIATVAIVYVAASVPPLMILGTTSTGVALSAVVSMAGALLVAWFWLHRDGATGPAFALGRPPSWRSALGWAALGTIGALAIFAAGAPLVQAFGLDAPDPQAVLALVTESPVAFVLWVIAVSWAAAGFGEELLWRGFLMDRLSRLPGLRRRAPAVLVIQAALFGLPHVYQGWGGVIVTGVVGLLFGIIRLRQRGNLWAAIIAHAAVDTVVMASAYAGELGWYAN
ncbi:CPBP family intramembrane glutamic endopeptidase [Aurantiacibacter spongiae]|uniref:CPBP family intramembrane metalloprotease n=1 Tax=Aurantiacibacter spongiae TaxID=2488860 RepID=A0A3N5DHC2_9SPHN|nr:type II CAAX endopeptidase family protein [Aurantiacibacter spongiae]RPF71062.1 CPBP family intramembrane metalloprotease [Aurantiacibacter spongiae]